MENIDNLQTSIEEPKKLPFVKGVLTGYVFRLIGKGFLIMGENGGRVWVYIPTQELNKQVAHYYSLEDPQELFFNVEISSTYDQEKKTRGTFIKLTGIREKTNG